MNTPTIREKSDPLAGFVFVLEGAQTLLGKLCEDESGKPYLEPVYVYRVGEEWQLNAKGEKVGVRPVRSLHPLFGYPEVLRKDLASAVGTSVNELSPKSRAELAEKVEAYEVRLRSMGIVRLVKVR